MDPATWIGFVKEVGFPIVAAVFGGTVIVSVGWAIWKCVSWIGQSLILPLRDAAVSFLQSFQRNVDRMTTNLDAQTVTLQQINHNQAEIKQTLITLASRGRGLRRDHQNNNGEG